MNGIANLPPCDLCRGAGTLVVFEIPASPVGVECDTCLGTGRRIPLDQKLCSYCRGDGGDPDELLHPPGTCPNCNGLGITPLPDLVLRAKRDRSHEFSALVELEVKLNPLVYSHMGLKHMEPLRKEVRARIEDRRHPARRALDDLIARVEADGLTKRDVVQGERLLVALRQEPTYDEAWFKWRWIMDKAGLV